MKDELWDEVSKKVNDDKEEIWKINKEFFLSHDPYNPDFYDGFYKKEIDYLTKDLKYSIEKVEENLGK